MQAGRGRSGSVTELKDHPEDPKSKAINTNNANLFQPKKDRKVHSLEEGLQLS
jgi:hypothetical protein